MKYLAISLAFLMFACSGGEEKGSETPSVTTKNKSYVNTQSSGLAASQSYEVKLVKMINPACKEGELCTYVNFEYPLFTGTGSERANINVGKFLALNLGMDIKDPKELLNIEGMIAQYFKIWNENQLISPGQRVAKNDFTLAGIDSGLGVLSIKFYTGMALGDSKTVNYYQVLNLNETTGEEVIFINHVADMPSFIMLSENEFRNQMGMKNNQPFYAIGFEFEYDVFTLPLNFAFTSKGLEYIYNPDEISLTATEVKSFTIPFEDLRFLVQLDIDYNDRYYENEVARELQSLN